MKTFKDQFAKTAVRVSMAAVVVFVGAGVLFGWSKADWAAWVQAVGAITALGTAIYVGRQEAGNAAILALDAEARALMRQAESVEAILSETARAVTGFNDNIVGGATQGNLSQAFEVSQILSDTINALDQIPLYSLGSGEMVLATIQMMTAAKLTVENRNSLKPSSVAPGISPQTPRIAAKNINDAADSNMIAILALAQFAIAKDEMECSLNLAAQRAKSDLKFGLFNNKGR